MGPHVKGLGWEWLDLGGRCVVWFLFAGFVCKCGVGYWPVGGVGQVCCLVFVCWVCLCCLCASVGGILAGGWDAGSGEDAGALSMVLFRMGHFLSFVFSFLFLLFISYLVGGHLFFIIVVVFCFFGASIVSYHCFFFFTIGSCLFFNS